MMIFIMICIAIFFAVKIKTQRDIYLVVGAYLYGTLAMLLFLGS